MALIVKENVGIFFEKLTPALKKETNTILKKAARIAWRHTVREVKETFPKGTGNLSRSFSPKVVKSRGKKKQAAVVSTSPYANIQNEGGTIRPRGQFLAIPIGDIARRTARWPRHWPGGSLFAFRSKRGNLLLARSDKKAGESGFLQYVLKKAVRLKGHHYLDAAAAIAEPEIMELFEADVQGVIDRVNGRV